MNLIQFSSICIELCEIYTVTVVCNSQFSFLSKSEMYLEENSNVCNTIIQ